jgi:hypothetical protein
MDRMTTEHILSYGYLTEDERRDVEAYVARHPEYAPVLDEARTLFDTICAEHQDNDEGLSDGVLLAHLVDTQWGHPGSNDTLIRNALNRSATLRARYDALAGRLNQLSSALDPVAHFEQLSGHSWPDASPREDRPPLSNTRADSRQRVSLVVGIAAAIALLAVGMFSIRLHAIDRLAYIGPEELDLAGFDAIQRSALNPPEEATSDLRYRYALSAFKHARSAGFGLFPRYDAELLTRAEEELKLVIAAEPSHSFLSQEARFTLARVYLAGDQRVMAREALADIAGSDSHRAATARDLMGRIAP